MDLELAKKALQTDEEKYIASLRREVEYWKSLTNQWKDTAARLDIFIEQKNSHIEKLEKTIKYLRNR